MSASGAVTVTFESDRPVTAAMPLWVRAHDGESSDPDVNEGRGTMPAGATSATVSTSLRACGGQVDAKLIFTGKGDERGRVGGPYITKPECGPAITVPPTSVDTTPTTTPPSSSVPGTTVPGVSTSTPGLSTPPAPPASGGPRGTAPSGPPLQLPATGGEWVAFVLTAVVLLSVGGLALVGRNHGKRDEPGRYPR